MDTNSFRLVSRLRRPEYTGENRCIPCTVLNVLISTLLAAVVAIWSIGLAALVLGFALVTVYLRGYLVPGTPWFTEQYVPAWILDYFDKSPTPDTAHQGGETDLNLEAWLFDNGIVEECSGVDDLCLTDDFEASLGEEIRELRARETEREELAELLDLSVEEVTFDEYGDSLVARHASRRVGQWESHAALLADVGASRALDAWTDAWGTLEIEPRGAVLNGLRIFLERCPSCDGPMSMAEETVESCCRSKEVVAVSCEACGARLFEAAHPG